MTYLELTREIIALPRIQRLELMTVIIQTLQDEEPKKATEESIPSFSSLRGYLKRDGPVPTDEEVDQMRYDYLMEKHS